MSNRLQLNEFLIWRRVCLSNSLKDTFEGLPIAEFDFVGVSGRVVVDFDDFGVKMVNDFSHENSV